MAKPLKKKPLKKAAPSKDTRRAHGEVKSAGSQYFTVTFNPDTPAERTYSYPKENGAVLFACIHSREHGWKARVDDPLGNHIVTFYPREYDVASQMRLSAFDTESLGTLQRDVAEARRKRLAATPPKKKTLKKKAS